MTSVRESVPPRKRRSYWASNRSSPDEPFRTRDCRDRAEDAEHVEAFQAIYAKADDEDRRPTEDERQRCRSITRRSRFSRSRRPRLRRA